MAGHVNMMDDVLISNLPPNILRSSLRVLISQGSIVQQPFVQHVRRRLLDSPPELLNAEILFPTSTSISPECLEFLALTRCIISSKLTSKALIYIVHFIKALTSRPVICRRDSEVEEVITTFGGDIVQAIQALKEASPELSDELHSSLKALHEALICYSRLCETQPDTEYPFGRAERQTSDVLMILFQSKVQKLNGLQDTLDLKLPTSSLVETFLLGSHKVPRLFNGFWQLSSSAWGSGTAREQEKALIDLVEEGLTAADMADHYGDAELIYGDFRNKLQGEVQGQVFAATKWCVFGPPVMPVTRDWVFDAVKERSRRLEGRVELLQFHWYDYEAKEYLDILLHLVNISEAHPELLSAVGLCNFDSAHTEEACAFLIAKTGKAGIVSNQVQFSLFDSRPLQRLGDVCRRHGLKLLTYGSFCGGFLTEKWLGLPAPDLYSSTAQLTPSARKYYDIITTWGSWNDFQRLLKTLSEVAMKHSVSLTNVATRWVLQQPQVGAVIVGTRLGVSSHGRKNLRVFGFTLDDKDLRLLNDVALGPELQKSNAMFERLGDCGSEYRAMH